MEKITVLPFLDSLDTHKEYDCIHNITENTKTALDGDGASAAALSASVVICNLCVCVVCVLLVFSKCAVPV